MNKILDENSYYHFFDIDDLIGAGGQGKVFRTENKNILLKIIGVENGKTKKSIENKIEGIRALNIPSYCKVAKPVSKINTGTDCTTGYIMRMMEDMDPISNLLEVDSYHINGGLKRRLMLLAKMAYTLSGLHGEDIVYGDISDSNIFVSTNPQSFEVWLIDCDNMAYTPNVDGTILTEVYAAPELQNFENKNSINSDIYSFGILAFWTLMVADPFYGGTVADSLKSEEKEDFSEDLTLKNKIISGEIPWVGEGKTENRPYYGMTRQMDKIFSESIMNLFEKTFSREGRINPISRPSSKEWYYALSEAGNSAITCRKCGATYYYWHDSCFNCETGKGDYYRVEVYENLKLENKDFQKLKKVSAKELISPQNKFSIYMNEIGSRFHESEETAFKLYLKNERKYIVENMLKKDIEVSDSSGELIKIKTGRKEEVLNFENLKIRISSDKSGLKSTEVKIKKMRS
ncbi:MAG: protein kinase domain-containing protein [Fusobacteriaceae bacterium]